MSAPLVGHGAGGPAIAQLWPAHGHEDDPIRARWACLHAPENCNVLEFDKRGTFLALALSTGQVCLRRLFEVGAIYTPACERDFLS